MIPLEQDDITHKKHKKHQLSAKELHEITIDKSTGKQSDLGVLAVNTGNLLSVHQLIGLLLKMISRQTRCGRVGLILRLTVQLLMCCTIR